MEICAGEKLIDHLKKWLEPDKLTQMGHEWADGQEAEVAAATLRLFHLLPSQAAKFLESGVRSDHALSPTALLEACLMPSTVRQPQYMH